MCLLVMCSVEDGDEEGLLPMGDASHVGPRGPKRYEQIGVDACTRLLEAATDKIDTGTAGLGCGGVRSFEQGEH